jgi:hypothetical protein
MTKPIDEMTWPEKAEEALRRAVARAIEEHRRMGVPIVVWKDGKVKIVPPEDIAPSDIPLNKS